MEPTLADAQARAVVRLSDGRTARLVCVPGTGPRRKTGAKCRVVLPSGKWLSIRPDELEVVSDA